MLTSMGSPVTAGREIMPSREGRPYDEAPRFGEVRWGPLFLDYEMITPLVAELTSLSYTSLTYRVHLLRTCIR